ncbi:hypothetical protein LEP1GSC186_4084 [Leptospira noguchii serovar Autumnalis str. ZUN142]|uniref:Uncharacterized protein n=1 Tax=Leptospira noguchii serovar Autumnalis str. ZUN142 TaxID=1085540 RepID=M6UGR2_9LEPT|nr:hypothetical protein LEP1GSC186_4084 [Leptospira noguchii serovar Autumnalis str. ZUN142]
MFVFAPIPSEFFKLNVTLRKGSMNELKQNASYHNLTHKLNRILESKSNSNSAKRFPKGRVLGSKTHIFQVFRQE